jgi:outer membrane lipoprotein SlyB
MTSRPLILALTLAGLMSSAWAQAPASPKEQYAIDSKHAATRYADDKKLCTEESDSSARMQCMRDAKSEYDKTMAQAKAAMKASPAKAGACMADCGKVIGVTVTEKAGEGSALGLIAGGVAGALLGNQVGSGHGRELATVAGAAGGAYAGKQVEQRVKSTKVWTVQVQYNNGQQASFNFDHDPGLLAGDQVRNANGTVVRN